MLTWGKEGFFAEKDGLLTTGLAVSPVVTVDDSGARHQGQNGYVTHIGNDDFSVVGKHGHPLVIRRCTEPMNRQELAGNDEHCQIVQVRGQQRSRAAISAR